MDGKLIVFEGPDCVGKSTLSHSIYEYLQRELGEDKIRRTSFPGKDAHGRLGQMVYQLHHVKQELGIEEINTKSLQMLHVAAHIDLIEYQILPWLREGKVVVMDRHYLSTWIYGGVFGVPKGFLYQLIELEQEVWQEFTSPTVIYVVVADSPYDKDIYKKETWQEIDKAYRAMFEPSNDLLNLYFQFNLELVNNDDLDTAMNRITKDLWRHRLGRVKRIQYAG